MTSSSTNPPGGTAAWLKEQAETLRARVQRMADLGIPEHPDEWFESLAVLIDGMLKEHWQTKQPWEGGTKLIDACGRCRYGDGVCYPARCHSLRLLAAHVAAVTGSEMPS